MTSKGYTKGWLQIHPKTCKVTSQLQHKASKMLLCIQIGIGKMGKMTTNRKHTKTQKLMRTQNTQTHKMTSQTKLLKGANDHKQK